LLKLAVSRGRRGHLGSAFPSPASDLQLSKSRVAKSHEINRPKNDLSFFTKVALLNQLAAVQQNSGGPCSTFDDVLPF